MAPAEIPFLDRLIPAKLFAHPEDRQRVRIMLLTIVVGTGCVLMFVWFALDAGRSFTAWQLAVIVVPQLLMYPVLCASGNIKATAIFYLLYLTCLVIGLLYFGYSQVLLGLILLPMVAAHLVGVVAAILWTVIGICIAVAWAGNNPNLDSNQQLFVQMLVIAVAAAGIASALVEKVRTQSLAELKLARQSVDVEKEKFRQVFQSVFPVLLEVRLGKICVAAQEIENLLGYNANSLLGSFLADYVDSDDSSRLDDLMQQNESSGSTVDIRMRHKQGHWVWIRTHLIVEMDNSQTPRWTLAGYDISVEKAQHAKLIQAQRLDSVGVLAAGLAHDFNNMLTVISGYADMLAVGEVRSRITESVDAAAVLVRELMAFGRNQPVVAQYADLAKVLPNMQAVLISMLGPRIEFEVVFPDGEWWVPIGTAQLNQVLVNLVTNAKEAMGERGKLSLSLDSVTLVADQFGLKRGDYVRMRVVDDGKGMDEEAVQYAFDPFFSTKQNKIGAGLGLSSVYGIVVGIGGRAEISSRESFGTTVDVLMPKLLSLPKASLELALPKSARVGNGSILVVEDDQLIADLIARNLVGAGFNVTIRNDVESAWAQLQDSLPDLLVTDIMMPDGRGTELAKWLRKENVETPILFISGYSDQEVGEWKEAQGQVKFLAKPFHRKELLAVVTELLGVAKHETV